MATDEAAVDELKERLDEVSLEDVVSRHRRERKELQAKLQEMKKNAPKNDKKKRKEFLEKMPELEKELEQRHNAELLAATQAKAQQTAVPAAEQPKNKQEASVSDDNEVDNAEPAAQQRVSKAQKRRDKKAREARQREEEIREELLNEEQKPSLKMIELQQITSKLAKRQLSLHQIPSDGDCLFNAIRHQLLLHGKSAQSVAQLRAKTAEYVRQHKETLIYYMTNPETGNLLNDQEFEAYCHEIAATHAWGGHIELKALSSLLEVPIEVLQAEGAHTMLGNEEFKAPSLVICYHRHIYQLGEHYNSTKPLDANEE